MGPGLFHPVRQVRDHPDAADPFDRGFARRPDALYSICFSDVAKRSATANAVATTEIATARNMRFRRRPAAVSGRPR